MILEVVVWVLYRDWLYRTKISKKFWRAKLEERMLEVWRAYREG